MNNNFTTIKPTSDLLKQYISYYYFDSVDKNIGFDTTTYYPHYKNALTINKGVKSIENESATINDYSEKKYSVNYTALQKYCFRVKRRTPYERVGIVFKPLGINNFLPNDLANYSNSPTINNFEYFENKLESISPDLFHKSQQEAVILLDHFFENNLDKFSNSRMKTIISKIHTCSANITVSQLSDELNMNRRTLLRLFKKHLLCSPKNYLSVVQFRLALNSYRIKNKSNLTDIAYESNYYDQSDFINHIKSITGFSPKRFFKELKHIGEEDTFCIFR